MATLVFLALALPLPGQQTPTFSSDVKVVNLLATVRDKHGQIVSNLTKDDFKLEEDGRPQTIRYFAKETDLPLTLGLLVDTSMSQRRVLEQERIASYAFLEHLMREDKDKAFVIHFDWDIELLQDLTSSRKKLNAALEKLDNPEFEQSGGGGGSPGSGGHHRGGGTTLYDAVFLASDELMQKQPGRKALIILSDGVDTGSKLTLTRAIEARWCTPSCSPTRMPMEAATAGTRAGWVGEWAVTAEAAWVEAVPWDIPSNPFPMARKFWSRSQGRPAAASLKFPRSNRSIKSTPALKKSCAISTA